MARGEAECRVSVIIAPGNPGQVHFRCVAKSAHDPKERAARWNPGLTKSGRASIPATSPESLNANAPMTGTMSRRKGASAELELCRVLSGHLGGSFIRTAGSGAYVGGKNSHRAQHLGAAQLAGVRGDLVPPDHLPRLVVESKSYAEFRFHQLMQPQGCQQLDQWIDQAMAGATATDMVVVSFKVTRTGWFIAVPAGAWVLGHHCRYGEWVVTDLNQFLADNAPTLLRVCGP